MDLFDSSYAGEWSQVSANLKVFKLYAAFVADATDDQLKAVINWANENGISLGLETGVLPVTTPDQPGWGVEGYNGAVVSQVQRIKDLGGTLSYLAMDEPLYFGTQWSGTNAAHSSIETVAQQAAATVKQLKEIFPDLKVGDIEPIPLTSNISEWLSAYEAAAGEPLDFFDADVLWDTDYTAALTDLATELRSRGIEYGVIFNGSSASESDAAWAADAIQHFITVESNSAIAPDDAIFQTWNTNPTRVLSETTNATMTNIILNYINYMKALNGGATTSSDTASYLSGSSVSGSHSNYQVALSGNGSDLIIRSSDSSSIQTVTTGIITFTDGTLVADPTGTGGDVARLYAAAFDRSPDQTGLTFWTSVVDASGQSLSAVAEAFADSSEFSGKYGSLDDDAFINQLYQNVLGRSADSSGSSYWEQELSSGESRGDVLNSFAQSDENKTNTLAVSGDATNAEISRLYEAAFKRTPSSTEVTYWNGNMASGETIQQVADTFIASDEFATNYGNLTNDQFVIQLYVNVLGRAPDLAGEQYWDNQMSAGASESQVLVGFANSAENRLATSTTTHDGWVFLASS